MANQKMLAFALMFMVHGVEADNCKTGSKGAAKLKASLAGLTCEDDEMSFKYCGDCCEVDPSTCVGVYTAHYKKDLHDGCKPGDVHKEDNLGTAATVANFKEKCCTARTAPKTCVYDCAKEGWKKKADYATIQCGSTDDACLSMCCDNDKTKCANYMESCGSDHYKDDSKKTVTYTNYKQDCCKAKKMCDFACPPTHKKKAKYAETKCSSDKCRQSECCDVIPNTCYSHVVTGADKGCGKNEYSLDSATTVQADSSDFKAKCCKAKATCEAFKAAKLEVSGAVKKQQAVATAILMSVGGYFQLGQ